MMKNHIGFSHHYTKLHGQTFGTLLRATPYVLDRKWTSEKTIQYDTDGVYPLPDGRYLQLVFIGDDEIPFTTYRTDTQEHRERFCDHINENFEFTFKSECEDSETETRICKTAEPCFSKKNGECLSTTNDCPYVEIRHSEGEVCATRS